MVTKKELDKKILNNIKAVEKFGDELKDRLDDVRLVLGVSGYSNDDTLTHQDYLKINAALSRMHKSFLKSLEELDEYT